MKGHFRVLTNPSTLGLEVFEPMKKPQLLYSYQGPTHHGSNPIWLPHNIGVLLIDGPDFVSVGLDHAPIRKRLPDDAPGLARLIPSPRGGPVLIEGVHGQIWIFSPLAQEARPLAFGRNPAWSPEGDAIAFFGNIAGHSELLVMRPNGIPYWSIGTDFGDSASWSPSGNQLVSTQDMRITTVNIDGSDVRRLVPSEWYGWGYEPKWSPGGDLIAFHQHADEIRLFVIDLNGSLMHTFTGFKNFDTLAWSPDGERLVCQDKKGIHVIDVGNEKRVFLTEGYAPCWSPSGKQILFIHEGSVYLTDV